jgi:hypothetical protein
MKRAHQFISLLSLLASSALATTIIGPIGPPASLRVIAEDHLFDVIVTPPKASKEYTPGQVKVYLMRQYPDYMLAELIKETLPNGDIRVHFAISPERIESYFIRVSDRQPSGEWRTLNETALKEIPRVKGRVSSLPNKSLERTRER